MNVCQYWSSTSDGTVYTLTMAYELGFHSSAFYYVETKPIFRKCLNIYFLVKCVIHSHWSTESDVWEDADQIVVFIK